MITCFRAAPFFVADTQNITLSLPRALLRRVKRVAADRETTVFALMTEALDRLTDEDRRYSTAKNRAVAAVKSAPSLEPRAGERGRATNYMSAESPREFVDANVLVYAFDASAAGKRQAAQRLVERLWQTGGGCVSVQVLQEFFVTVTKNVARASTKRRRVSANCPLGACLRRRPVMCSMPSPYICRRRLYFGIR